MLVYTVKLLQLCALGGFIALFAGCKTPPAAARPNLSLTENTRDNCYSLLKQLLDNEKDVNLLHLIKTETPDLRKLIKRISTTAADGSKQLAAFSKEDSTLALDHYDLPAGEVKTRDAISKLHEKELLHTSGATFELGLLLTQVEALTYGAQLAKLASENDPQPDRSRYLISLSEQLTDLHDEVIDRLAVKYPAAPSH
jgi:hypothetical protein